MHGSVFACSEVFLSLLACLSSVLQVAKAPDGNGGLYAALEDSGTLADMAGRGVEALDVLCVDNILARVGDPEFVGACYARGSELGARMLAKAYPEEKVGVFAQDERGRMQVGEGAEGVAGEASG
jgi:UDP-N-acetylglucosamine/UDP-N-acetylgalactosamine diphosphorylase